VDVDVVELVLGSPARIGHVRPAVGAHPNHAGNRGNDRVREVLVEEGIANGRAALEETGERASLHRRRDGDAGELQERGGEVEVEHEGGAAPHGDAGTGDGEGDTDTLLAHQVL